MQLGVAAIIQPKLNEQIKAGFEMYARPLVEATVQHALASMQEKTASGEPHSAAAGGDLIDKALAAIPAFLDSWTKFKSVSQPPAEQLASIFHTWLQGVQMGSKLKSGPVSAEDLTGNIEQVIGGKK